MDSLIDTFDRAMARFAPFEPHPDIAVAVSGGADSLALALLADRWARSRGGRATALTVDHGLRRESAAEARQVGRWLKSAGIRHRVLRWSHGPAAMANDRTQSGRMANLQAEARDARYALLCAWCRAHGVLTLLLAHHRDDQAETLLLRLARGSGLDGLAAMTPLAERDGVRLLRPLLSVPKAQLTGFLAARGQDWIEDPSNRDAANARVRVRTLLPRLAEEGMTVTRLAETAERLAQARSVLNMAAARLLALSVAVYPEGYLQFDTAVLRSAEREVGLRALARIIACIGGASYGPRLERLTRLYDMLCGGAESALGRGRTLGGCRIVPLRTGEDRAGHHVLVLREPAAVAPALRLSGETWLRWDGRFVLSADTEPDVPLSLGALGEDGWRELRHGGFEVPVPLPRDAIVTLPALRNKRAVIVAVPLLGYLRDSHNMKELSSVAAYRVDFAPVSPLTRPGFTLV